MLRTQKIKKLQLKIIILIIASILVLIAIVNKTKIEDKTVELTQFSNSDPTTQMMGYEIKTCSGKVILIDSGTKSDTKKIIEKINKDGGKVDYWFITHPHHDHSEAFCDIVENTDIPIDKIYISLNDIEWYEKNCEPNRLDFLKRIYNIIKNSRIKNNVIEPKINDEIEIDTNFKAEILGIRNPEIVENAMNEQSMVILFQTEENKILFLGDTGIKSSQKLLNTQINKLKSDIVQMAHHGQKGATEELYKAILPKICLYPAPEWLWNNDNGNGYNSGEWKSLETRKWMDEIGVKESYTEKEEITLKVK